MLKSLHPLSGGVYRTKRVGVDLNFGHASRFYLEARHEFRKDTLCAIDGSSSMDHVFKNRQPLSWQSPRSGIALHRTLPSDGLW